MMIPQVILRTNYLSENEGDSGDSYVEHCFQVLFFDEEDIPQVKVNVNVLAVWWWWLGGVGGIDSNFTYRRGVGKKSFLL